MYWSFSQVTGFSTYEWKYPEKEIYSYIGNYVHMYGFFLTCWFKLFL